MEEDHCVLCEKSLDEGKTIHLQEKAIRTLISASIERQDNKHRQFRGKDDIILHSKCRKGYIHSDSIKACIRAKKSKICPASTRTGTAIDFDFEKNCLFCGKDASESFTKNQSKKKNVSKRETVSLVKDERWRKDILRQAAIRLDQWADAVMNRILLTEDLIVVKARYHSFCHIKFMREPSQSTKNQSREDTPDIVSLIQQFIQDHPDERNFSLNKITENLTGSVPNNQWLKRQLYEKLGNEIIITSNPGVEPIIYLRDTGHKILLKHFQESEDDESQRRNIVTAAAKIITQDIRSQDYEVNNYPSPHSFLANVEEVIPDSLRLFLETVIVDCKREKDNNKYLSKIVSIAHAIISCVRPRSFLSCLQIGLGAMLNRKFGSKSLLDILSSLGFCCSYDDSLLFEASILMEPSNASIANDSFSQFVFDNADHNINTIDGLHTFHAMGGIECVTPASAVSCGSSIPKLKKLPSADTIGTFGAISLKNFDGYRKSGLGNVIVENLNLTNPTVRYEFNISSTDFLWLYNYKTHCIDVQGWNGFMENVNRDKQYLMSRIVCLPFLNSPPGNYDTIYTVLNVAAERMKSKNQEIAFVTFDQPLYMKAMEIIHCSDDPNLKKVVVRLGGFHLLMSFLGTIGNIMDGSGLKELFSEIYAPASVDKMLAGHAYSRAIRAHTLSHCALAQIILSFTDFSGQDILKLTGLLENSHAILESIENDSQFNTIKNKFIETVEKLSNNSGTAKLWTQYFHMVSLVKMFIEAERSGNWQLHLETVQRMLPYFHSSGHYLYAKSAHLYLQNMYSLPEKMDRVEYEQFVEGCFTIRRTNKFWSGIWSDMTIEQFLMRSMKDIGGPTRGRGMSDSVLSKWVLTTPALVYLTESVTEFCNVFLATTEQHVDARPTRISRDDADVKKLINWLDNHNPFPQMEGIISLSSGLKGDGKINCHEALEIGLTCLENTWRTTDDQCPKTFSDIKFKKINKITSLKSLVSSVKIADRTVTIDPSLIFQRICVLQKSESELKSYFNHELAPYPLSLFDDNGMRKTQKSKLYDFFIPIELRMKTPNDSYVIDGGFLLHKVVWQPREIFKDILERYVNYLVSKYSPNCIVVFDGYPENADEMFTKSAERQRRMRANSAPEVKFDLNMPSTLTQDKFLSNEKNKSYLIHMLSEKLRNIGIGVKQADEDADYLIVQTAISICDQYHSVFIVGEDIDLLVILTQNADSENNLYFIKPGRGKVEEKMFSVNSFMYPEIKNIIGFIHAFTGCDATSALYKQGKAKLIKLLKNDLSGLRMDAEVFNNPNSSKSSVNAAGQKIIMSMYGAKKRDDYSFHEFRYLCFTKSTLKSTFNLSALPPTDMAANEHSLRTYLQVREWHGDNSKDPMQWGWKKVNNILAPITSKKEPIPQELLEIISCGCDRGNCVSNCTCRKLGLKCTILCKICHGQRCSNTAEPDVIVSDDDDEDDNDLTTVTDMIENNEDLTYTLDTNDTEETNDDLMTEYLPACKRMKHAM